jgi:hypothetical protein
MTVLVLFVRISDNVLDKDDWPVRQLFITDGKVTRILEHRSGAYGLDRAPTVGWTLEQIEKWAAYDPTGQHPEVYHDVSINGGASWIGGPELHRFLYAE